MGNVHLMAHQLINNKLELWSCEYTGPKFHAVFCDPPYGLKFMGKDWDVVSAKEWGEALLPHLYPGALCLMFGGTRTWHKLATGMEEAGFEIWDTLMWLYGQGFPKGQDISKLIDKKNGDTREALGIRTFADGTQARRTAGASGMPGSGASGQAIITAPGSELSAPWSGHKTCALKPAWEPILAFRVPVKTTYADLALEYGSGTLNVDGTRIEGDVGNAHWSHKRPVTENPSSYRLPSNGQDFGKVNPHQGRYPANLLLDPESAALLDEQSGVLTSGVGAVKRNTAAGHKGNAYGTESRLEGTEMLSYGDSGGASRFFYCAKASTAERNGGLEKNNHPTVKPLALTEYLAKLLLPPQLAVPRRLLVPFAGSGSEMIGALKAGWDEVVGIEQDTEQGYCRIAEARIAHHLGAA